MTSILEKGGGTFAGIKMLLCENPLPPLDEAIAAAQEELACSNYYTEAYSAPLRRLLSEQLGVPERLIHINAGSELILRQLFARLGKRTSGESGKARDEDLSLGNVFLPGRRSAARCRNRSGQTAQTPDSYQTAQR